jgi:2-keto-4-pentenoate hydratase/2-oxohepta-3-ene-1,7-dioic acid hydratase in catechol pathway
MRVLRTVDGALLVEGAGGAAPLAGAWDAASCDGAAPRDVREMIERGLLRDGLLAELVEAWTAAGRTLADPPAVLAPPLRPGKILALGRNYAAHAREMGSAPSTPFFFSKLPSCCIGLGEPIRIPADLDGEVHHEVELAVVIGRTGRRIPVDRALEHVAGYAVIIDVTARTLQAAAKEKGRPWTAAKNLDTFAPLGPGIVPADAVSDPGSLGIRLRVNGDIRQDGSTAAMLLPVGPTVAHLSRHLTLETGDLIATGTPAGVGPLEPGDTVEAEVDGVGRLVHPVALEEPIPS